MYAKHGGQIMPTNPDLIAAMFLSMIFVHFLGFQDLDHVVESEFELAKEDETADANYEKEYTEDNGWFLTHSADPEAEVCLHTGYEYRAPNGEWTYDGCDHFRYFKRDRSKDFESKE